MTPTEKDAMALAVLDAAAETIWTEFHTTCDQSPDTALREARAHLASRIAELETEVAAQKEIAAACNRNTGRAEAELAAVLNFLRDDSLAATFQTLGQYRGAAINAAREGK